MMDQLLFWIVIAALIGLVLLPPQCDPAVRLVRWIRSARRRRRDAHVGRYPPSDLEMVNGGDPERGIPVSETPEGRMWLTIASGTCPACKRTADFLEGPHGGMSVNIMCARCNTRFNVTPAIGIAERLD